MTPASLVTDLRRVVGEAHVLSGAELTAQFVCDWTGRWRGETPCVVLPASAEELQAVVGVLVERGVPYLPQGGNTGLVGGATPLGGEVVLSTRRLTGVVHLDPDAGEVVVRAGTVLAEVQAAAAAAGWELPVDLAVRAQATIGGMIATDAAGLRALRHGRMRARLLGLEVVLPTGGRLDRIGRVPKDGTGYDLVGLLAGSEGTLGTVTRARLRLVRPARSRATALVALASVADAVTLAQRALGRLACLESLELVEAEGVELVAEEAGTHPPLAGRALLLIDCASDTPPEPELRALLVGAPEVRGILVATDEGERRELWSWREGVPGAIAAAGIAHKIDVGVGIAELPALLAGARAAVARLSPAARLVAFGHLGEGNLHLNVLGLDPGDERVEAAVLALVAELGGSIAAEHGVGRAKPRFVALTRALVDVEAMLALKRALDPSLLANPGVIFSREMLMGCAPAAAEEDGATGALPRRW